MTDYPRPTTFAMPFVIQEARAIHATTPAGRPFNRVGLAYPLRTLGELDVRSMSTEQLVEYADAVTMAFPDAVIEEMAAPVVLNSMATSWANMAYIASHATVPKHRDIATETLALSRQDKQCTLM